MNELFSLLYQTRNEWIKMKRRFLIMICLVITILLPNTISYAANDSNHEARMKMYKDYELASGIPWYQIAAIDQYERNIYKFNFARNNSFSNNQIIKIVIDICNCCRNFKITFVI